MKALRILLCIAIGALLIAVAGCCCCGGGTDKETTVIEKQPVNTPLGEELIKLKEAHDQGTITDEEYEAAKQKLLQQ